MTQVDFPMSMIHLCTTRFRMDTKIWKVMVDGIHGSPFSVSNVIKLDSEGSTAPRVTIKAFHYISVTERNSYGLGG